jgi:hypothetical protein
MMLGALAIAFAAFVPEPGRCPAIREDSDQLLFESEPRIDALVAKWRAAIEVYCDAETSYFSTKPPRPRFDEGSDDDNRSSEAFPWASKIYEEECAALRAKFKIDLLAEAAGSLCDEVADAITGLCAQKARTFDGLLLQAQMTLFWEKELYEGCMSSVLENLVAFVASP